MDVKVKLRQPNGKHCFVCGTANSSGLKSDFYTLENDFLVALFCPEDAHQGYPGRLHGGLSATILDESIGRAINKDAESDTWGVTVNFSIRFRKPVPLERELRVVCRITRETRRTFDGEGVILLADGTVAAEGKGTYMKMELTNIADMDVEGDEWVVLDENAVPETISIPENLFSVND